MSPAKAAATANGAAVFNLDEAARAAADEAAGLPFRFTYKGESYDMPNQREWSLVALRAFAAGDLEAALEQIMGEAALNRLTNAGLTLGELGVLFEEASRVAGFGNLPNSGPPPRRASTRR